MADNLNTTNLSRRSALAGGLTGAAGLIAGGAGAALAGMGNPDAGGAEIFKRLEAEMSELHRQYGIDGNTDAEDEAIYERLNEVRDAMIDTPASTTAGVLVKLERWIEEDRELKEYA